MSADGFVLTPVVIFKGQNYCAGWYKYKKEEEYWYRYQPKGFNNSQLCYEYLELVFEPETRTHSYNKWQLLIFDGFESHIDLKLIKFCLEHHILPFCLPAHTSHVLQPLEVAVFSALEQYYSQEVNKLRIPIDKNNFPNLLAHARHNAFSQQNIASGFRATGITLYNPPTILNSLSLSEPPTNSKQPPPPIPCTKLHLMNCLFIDLEHLLLLAQFIICMLKRYLPSIPIAHTVSNSEPCTPSSK